MPGSRTRIMLWMTGLLVLPTTVSGELTPGQMERVTPVVRVFEQARGAVVNISATMEVENYQRMLPFGFFDDQFGSPRYRKRTARYTSIGSGFVIHEDGYVVTNAHVVMSAVDQKVIFADGTEYEADRVAVDEKHDLAVLKISSDQPLPMIKLGRSDDLMIGEAVIAIGNPLGYEHTVTSGIISALNRKLTFSEDVEYEGLIQTDASINRGNSGGPLLNVLGELIGINTAIRGDAQNIGFAIPVDTLRMLMPEILSVEHRKRLQTGLRLSWRDRVHVVEATGPAARAGIEPGDELLRVGDIPIRQDFDFYIIMLNASAGDVFDLELQRDGRSFHAKLEPREIPIPDGAHLLKQRCGLSVEMMSRDDMKRIHPSLEAGLLITSVEHGSPGDRAGFTRGHIIFRIGKYFPKDLTEVGLLLEKAAAGETMVFGVLEVRRQAVWVLQGEIALR